MANLPAIVLGSTLDRQRQVTASDTLLVGAGIDRSAAGVLAIGAGIATTINIGNATTNPGVTVLGTGDVVLANGTLSVPAGVNFKIAGTALTTANFTAANIDKLLNGSNADALHVHAGSSVAYIATSEVGSPSNGMAVYFSGNDEVTPTNSNVLISSRFVGVRTGVNTYQVAGEVAVQLVGSLTVSAGQQLFLSSTAGMCTNVAPVSGYLAEVGIVADASAYSGTSGQTVQMIIQPKAVVTRS